MKESSRKQVTDLRTALHKAVRAYLVGLVGEAVVRENVIFNISEKVEATLMEVFESAERAERYCIYAAAKWVERQIHRLDTPAMIDKLVLDNHLCQSYVLKGWDNIESRRKTLLNAQFARSEGSLEDARTLIHRYESEYLSLAYASLLKLGEIPLSILNPNPFWVFASRKLGRFSGEEIRNHCPVMWAEIPVMYKTIYMTLEQAVTNVANTFGDNDRFYMTACKAVTDARYDWVTSTGALVYCPNPIKTDYINKSGIEESLIEVDFEDYLGYLKKLKQRNEGLEKSERKPNTFLTSRDRSLFEWVAGWQKRKIVKPPKVDDVNDEEEKEAKDEITINKRQNQLDPILASVLFNK